MRLRHRQEITSCIFCHLKIKRGNIHESADDQFKIFSSVETEIKTVKNTPRTRSEININCLFTIITCIIIIIIYLLLANNSLFLAPDTHFTFFILYSFKPGHSLKLFVMIIISYNLKLKTINYNSQESNRDAATNWQVKKHLHVFI